MARYRLGKNNQLEKIGTGNTYRLENGRLVPLSDSNALTLKEYGTDYAKQGQESERFSVFNRGAFNDGYQFGDVIKTINATNKDIKLSMTQGIANMAEGVSDLLAHGVSGVSRLLGAETFADDVKAYAQRNTADAIFDGFGASYRDDSALGPFGQKAMQTLGQATGVVATGGLGAAAGLGTVGTTALTTGTMFASSMGSGIGEAYNQGATDGQAWTYGALKGAVDAGSELLFGGLGKTVNALGISRGIGGLDDMFAKKVSSKISNVFFRNAAQWGIKSAGEGVEEVLSELGSAVAKKLTYASNQELRELINRDDLLESFVLGTFAGGVMQGGDLISSVRNKTDFVTGMTENESKVVDRVVGKRITEQEADGTKLTGKEKNAIYDRVVRDLEKGYIGTDTIEEVLGSEAPTLARNDRLYESYLEPERKKQSFAADLTQYDERQREVVQKAIESGILNNSNKTHDFVDMLAKLSSDKGVSIDFTNHEKLINSGFAMKDGVSVNGFLSGGNITVNIESQKALNTVVGHEITHVLEGTETYRALSDAAIRYAKTKGEYDSRLSEIKTLYETVQGADVEGELVADLVGDYLFTDEDFIKSLSYETNVFKRIFDEIKYLCKTAIAGSKEARELEKVKRAFERAYQKNTATEESTDVKYALEKFAKDYDAWDRKNQFKIFEIGMTSEALKSIGVDEKNITIDASKILKIKAKHQGMTDDVIKEIPKIINDPMVILESKQSKSRVVLVGEVTDANGKSVVVALELQPTNYSGAVIDEIKVASTYGKDNIQNFINNSKILFVNPDAKKISSWLTYNRLQLPFWSTTANNKIAQNQNDVNPKNSLSFKKANENSRKQMKSEGKYGVFGDDVTRRQGDDIAPLMTRANKKEFMSDGDVEEHLNSEKRKRRSLDSVGENNPINTTRSNTTLDVNIPQNPENTSLIFSEDSDVSEKDSVQADERWGFDEIAPLPRRTGTEMANEATSRIESVKTVAERIEVKKQASKEKIEDLKRDLEFTQNAYDEDIAKRQQEYESKKKKDTKVAANLLNQIAALKRRKENNRAEQEKRINDEEARLEKMNTKEYETAMQRKEKQQGFFEWAKELVGDTTNWKDKKLGISYKINTLRRNLRDVVHGADGQRDFKHADRIYDELQGKYNEHEAKLKRESQRIKRVFAKMDINRYESEYIQKLGEFRHNPETKLQQKDIDSFFEAHKGEIDTKKVDKAIEEARTVYDSLLGRINAVLKDQGMKEIPYRQGYFPHFTEAKQGKLAKLLNWKPVNTEIPTDIAGITEQFTPNRSWQSFNKKRTTDDTDYNFLRGLDTYVHGALDWIYHIEDIQRRRAFENYIRYVHSDSGVKTKVDEINKRDDIDAEEMQDLIDNAYKEAANPLNNFVTDLHAGTNVLAGKKASMDRTMEEATNRKFYSVMTNVSSRVSVNQVVGSLSSALTNLIPITQSWMEVPPKRTLQAIGEVIKNVRSNDGLAERSTFLTNRLLPEENLHRTKWDDIGDVLGKPMSLIDEFSSQVIWRSKYIDNIENGMSEEKAIKNADQFSENVMAGRSRGNNPTIFDSKNMFIKMLTAFQLEVNNQYGYMFKDVPQDMRNEAKGKLVKGYATAFVGAYLFNALYSSLTGRDAALDPIGIIQELFRDMFDDDDEKEGADIVLDFTERILQEVPLVGGILGGGRIPISSILPYGQAPMEAAKSAINDFSEGEWASLAEGIFLNPILYGVLPMGGGQLRKTYQGLKMFDDDLPVAGSYTKSGNLRFPVKDNPLNRLQAAVFGQYASKNAREYFDGGYAPLREKQIQEFKELDLPIADYRKYRSGLSKQESVADKVEYIAELPIANEKKNILVNNALNRKNPVDLSNYDAYADFEEFDFFCKNRKKYEFLKEHKVSYQEYSGSEDSKRRYDDVYSWVKSNPEKVTVSKAVSEDVIEYRRIIKELSDIESDKAENGSSISGSAKEKRIAYINELKLDYGQKLLLYRSLYSGKEDKDRYNRDIVDYLNGRMDLTVSQIKTILRSLEFTVDDDGTIRW